MTSTRLANKSLQRTWGAAPRGGLGRQPDLNSAGILSLSPRPTPLNSGVRPLRSDQGAGIF
jgi:hypothetical protein